MIRSAAERILAGLALMVLSPLLALLALAVAADSGLPVLFRQKRIGRRGEPFDLLKFRSMRTGMAGTSITAGSDPRVTRAGAVLRKYKLDELPQLWNVFNGTMSLIGPRPEIPRFVDPADPLWRDVLELTPGITDLATLVYRDEESILAGVTDPEEYYRSTVLPAKLRMNLDYARRRTWPLDLELLLLTARYSFSPAGFDADMIRRRLTGAAR